MLTAPASCAARFTFLLLIYSSINTLLLLGAYLSAHSPFPDFIIPSLYIETVPRGHEESLGPQKQTYTPTPHRELEISSESQSPNLR